MHHLSLATTNNQCPLPDSHVVAHPQYHQVVFHGDFSAQALVDLGIAMVEYAKRFKVTQFLLDLTPARGQMSVIDRYEIVDHLAEIWPMSLKMVTLVRPSQTLNMGFFWERMAKARGFDMSVELDASQAAQRVETLPIDA